MFIRIYCSEREMLDVVIISTMIDSARASRARARDRSIADVETHLDVCEIDAHEFASVLRI